MTPPKPPAFDADEFTRKWFSFSEDDPIGPAVVLLGER